MARKVTLLVAWMVLTLIGSTPLTATGPDSEIPTTTVAPTTSVAPETPTTTVAPETPTTTVAPETPTTTVAPVTPTTTVAPATPTTTVAPETPTTTVAPETPTTTVALVTPTTTVALVTPTTTVAPETPTATVAPVTPTTTVAPETPTATVAPTTSVAPETPMTTVAPETPMTTVAPVTPMTTVAPVTPMTTVAPETPMTTVAPVTPMTTVAPTTSVAPETPMTTVAPETPMTTVAPVTPMTTVAPTTSVAPETPMTTVAPVTPTTTVAPATPTTTVAPTEKPDPCQSSPCLDGSTCEPRGNGTVCLCLPGDSYDEENRVCVQAKVFPGEVDLQEPYTGKLGDKTSQEFQNLEEKLCSEISKLFGEVQRPKDCVVEEFQAVNRISRSSDKVKAIYQLFFDQTSLITTAQVTAKLDNPTACGECTLIKDSTFISKSLCVKDACDEKSTVCAEGDGSFKCDCKKGYVNTTFSDRVCLAITCPEGQSLTDEGCKTCSFGRSGYNCNDVWKLALVIVGSVLGGLLLATSIVLIIVATKSSKKGSKKAKHSGTGKLFPAQGPLLNGTNGRLNTGNVPEKGKAPFPDIGVPRIPRATTDSSWDRRTNLEMTPSNSRQNLVPSGKNSRLYDEINEINPHSRPQNVYAQTRPQNPYAQNRANINPYAQNQGRTNPNYMDDDRRRY